MTCSETYAASTLKEIRCSVEADSALFGERLKPVSAMPESAGYSDIFMEMCGGDEDAAAAVRLGIEYIFEGYLLHYGESRLLGPDDGHFRLLTGDYMYARGLEAIAGLGDLACITALAELVRLCSFVHCERLDPGLAARAWAVTTLGLAARVSSGGTTPISGMPSFGELEKLDGMFEELLDADSDSLRERFSKIEAEFHGS